MEEKTIKSVVLIDENENETERLIDMLAAYNETNDLFYFCGHTHMPLFQFWSFHNYDGYPETYLPHAKSIFPETFCASDGMHTDLCFEEDDA